MITALPSDPGFDREHAILTALCDGEHDPIVWSPITRTIDGHSIHLWVAEDALKIEGVRVTMGHRLAQLIADHFDARLPTSLISDLAWEQSAVRIQAMPQPWFADGSMATTARMIQFSAMLDTAIGGRSGLVSSIGKDWILTRSLTPDVGANYGFHYTKLGSTRVWQTIGTAHNTMHHDYSQSLRLVCRTCEVDGARVALDDVLRSATLARLVSSEGAMPFVRHPGVPFAPPLAPLEDPCTT